jgi:hypothetical protein
MDRNIQEKDNAFYSHFTASRRTLRTWLSRDSLTSIEAPTESEMAEPAVYPRRTFWNPNPHLILEIYGLFNAPIALKIKQSSIGLSVGLELFVILERFASQVTIISLTVLLWWLAPHHRRCPESTVQLNRTFSCSKLSWSHSGTTLIYKNSVFIQR